MRRGTLQTPAWSLMALGAAFALSACGSAEDPNTLGNQNGDNGNQTPGGQTGNDTEPPTPEEQVQQILDARKTDYGEALRTASLKLRDELPTLAEIKQVEAAGNDAAKKVVYEKLVDDMIASPQFAMTMVRFWRDTFRTGQANNKGETTQVQQGQPNKDTAALFAAQIVVEGRPYTDLLTAETDTCPTFDAEKGEFTAGSCNTNPTSGVLTDPGILAQYFANMAFRRVRFIQETFGCAKHPVEFGASPVPMGSGTYTGPYKFESITGLKNNEKARVDFQDTSAVICANCHVTLNHAAFLFAKYDDKGALQNNPQVKVPIPGEPAVQASDYLPDGEQFAWRYGKPVSDIPAFGKSMAEDYDKEISTCAVNRMWNYAMSRGDIVNDLATVPQAVTGSYVDAFKANGWKLKETIRAIFKSEDFTKF